MNTRIFLLILLFNLAGAGNYISAQAGDSIMWWSDYSAFLQPKGHLSFGLVQSLRYGFTERIEFSASPLIFPLDPNFKLKIRYPFKKNLILSSEHGIHIPTPFLRFVSKEGVGGIIPPQYKMPWMCSFSNGILLSYLLPGNYVLTMRGGFSFPIRSEKPHPGSTIDLPFVFPMWLNTKLSFHIIFC